MEVKDDTTPSPVVKTATLVVEKKTEVAAPSIKKVEAVKVEVQKKEAVRAPEEKKTPITQTAAEPAKPIAPYKENTSSAKVSDY